MTTTPRSTPVVSAAGIVDREDGERAIPQSVRADGSVRKERKVRPGFQPVEDIQRYKPPQSRYRSPGSLPSSPRQLDKSTIAEQQETDKKTIIRGLESLIPENKHISENKIEKKTEKKDDAILQQPSDTDIIAQKDKQDTTKEEDELTSKLADMQLGSMASVYATADPNERVEEQPQANRGRGRGRSRGRSRGTRGRKP